MSEEEEVYQKRGVYLFGRDLSQIPCFRNSFLYGISGGIGSGLVYFMFTSKVPKATNVGFGSFLLTTWSYWFYCRYMFSKTKFELLKIEHALQETISKEGTLGDVDISEFESPAAPIDIPKDYEKKL